MQTLYDIVKNLMIIIVMASFLELLLPNGRIKPFVRFAVGLFVLIAILNPCLNWLFHEKQYEISLWDYQLDQNLTEDVQAKGAQLQQNVMERRQAIIQEKVQGQINAVTSLVAGVNDVQTEVDIKSDGSIKKIELTVRPVQNQKEGETSGINVFSGQSDDISETDKEQIENKILQVINNLYGVPNEAVSIHFEGG